jgi:hypothetical protein
MVKKFTRYKRTTKVLPKFVAGRYKFRRSSKGAAFAFLFCTGTANYTNPKTLDVSSPISFSYNFI